MASKYEELGRKFTKSPIPQQDATLPLTSVENFAKSVENLELACGNAVEYLGKS
ncbi:hypothetical protein [Microcoleus sp. herbarium12]|uniref:hypothetical protein n=1 Tax=Microcoleus sp. herbarium12 TaxID=3055437 RepID=UPI002FD1E771